MPVEGSASLGRAHKDRVTSTEVKPAAKSLGRASWVERAVSHVTLEPDEACMWKGQ